MGCLRSVKKNFLLEEVWEIGEKWVMYAHLSASMITNTLEVTLTRDGKVVDKYVSHALLGKDSASALKSFFEQNDAPEGFYKAVFVWWNLFGWPKLQPKPSDGYKQSVA